MLSGTTGLHEEGILAREPEILAGGSGTEERTREWDEDQEKSQGDLRVREGCKYQPRPSVGIHKIWDYSRIGNRWGFSEFYLFQGVFVQGSQSWDKHRWKNNGGNTAGNEESNQVKNFFPKKKFLQKNIFPCCKVCRKSTVWWLLSARSKEAKIYAVVEFEILQQGHQHSVLKLIKENRDYWIFNSSFTKWWTSRLNFSCKTIKLRKFSNVQLLQQVFTEPSD